ncbi:MAG: KTSC domain-containing protein [Chloroflexi bacterium]|nr:KTSC domain-containing protein [Chloroflexota bacterium]
MNRTPVNSRSLASVGYDVDSMTLEVEFLDGQVYQYFDVPEFEHQSLMQADSHGTYFHANIRNTYRYTRT